MNEEPEEKGYSRTQIAFAPAASRRSTASAFFAARLPSYSASPQVVGWPAR